MVELSSSYPLPTPTWHEPHPGFFIAESSGRDEPVRRQFSKQGVYYAGSHEGCGCGFR